MNDPTDMSALAGDYQYFESSVPFTALSDRQVALFAAVNLVASMSLEEIAGNDAWVVSDFDALVVGVADRFLTWLEG